MRVLSGLPVKKRVPFGSQEHAVISSVCLTKVLIRVPVYKLGKSQRKYSFANSKERGPIRIPLCPRASLSCPAHMIEAVSHLGSSTVVKQNLHGP